MDNKKTTLSIAETTTDWVVRIMDKKYARGFVTPLLVGKGEIRPKILI